MRADALKGINVLEGDIRIGGKGAAFASEYHASSRRVRVSRDRVIHAGGKNCPIHKRRVAVVG